MSILKYWRFNFPVVSLLVVESMRAALQKLESRVAMLEKTPAQAAVPCAKVDDQKLSRDSHF